MVMRTFTFVCETDAQFAALQQAALFLAEMHQLAQNAPPGQVLDRVEDHALDAGRQFLRDALQNAVQQRIDADEAKGGRPDAARVRARSASKGGTAATW
jgi:hypothetical protein